MGTLGSPEPKCLSAVRRLCLDCWRQLRAADRHQALPELKCLEPQTLDPCETLKLPGGCAWTAEMQLQGRSQARLGVIHVDVSLQHQSNKAQASRMFKTTPKK